MPADTSQKTIKNLFYEQVKRLSLNSVNESFDYQFSDRWL